MVSSNRAVGGSGGGIYNNGGTITVTGSIISRNMATGLSSVGGGIFSVGTMTISHSTISDNTAAISGGGIIGCRDDDHHRQHDQRQPGWLG